jgi:hypothetical protein
MEGLRKQYMIRHVFASIPTLYNKINDTKGFSGGRGGNDTTM